MKVFICWSGERSHQIAKALYYWLPKFKSDLEPFVSSELEKGIYWFSQIMHELERSKVGIICLTPENLHSTWLHFEAGALARYLAVGSESTSEPSRARVYTYLHRVDPGQLTGPLAAYQSTSTVREDTERLIESIVRFVPEDTEEPPEWRENFKKHWPELENTLRRIEIPVQELIPGFEGFFQRKTFNEPLHHCTAQTWADRYDGARQTYERLLSHLALVREACPRYQVDLYEDLQAQADAYAMDMKALLLKAEPFELNEQGELEIRPPGVLKACESRRLRIKDLVSHILDPLDVPKTDDAVRFMGSESFAQKKMLVHRKEHEIHQHKEKRHKEHGEPVRGEAALEGLVDRTKLREYRASSWDLDRIYYYLIKENLGEPSESSLEAAVGDIVMEMETLRSKTENASMMPLHYALGALSYSIPSKKPVEKELAGRVENVLQDIETYIEESEDQDKGGQVDRTIAEVRDRMRLGADSGNGHQDRDTGDLSWPFLP